MATIYDSGFGGDMGGAYGGYDYAAEEERRRREAQRQNAQQSPYQAPTQDDERRQPTYQTPRTAPPQEPERSPRPQDTRTFAARQQAGEARPAPPPPQPTSGIMPPPQVSLPVTAPQPVLYGTTSPGPGRFGLGGPVAPGDPREALNQQGGVTGGGVDPIATIGAAGQRPDWMTATGGIGTMPKPNEDGSTTWTNVETPVANAPQYTAGNPPPANAVNGSTFRDASGTVWTKRLGMWVVEADATKPNQGMPTGYGALTPTTLQQQTLANLPQGAGSTMSRAGVDSFLRQYGTPANDQQWATLAAQSGMKVDDLKQMVNRFNPRDPLRYESQQAIADNNEWAQWMKDNPGFTALTPVSPEWANWSPERNIPNVFWDMYRFVPERDRAQYGGAAVRRRTPEEMRAAGFQVFGGDAFYNDPKNEESYARSTGMYDWLKKAGYTFNNGTGGPTSGSGTTTGGTTGGTGGSSVGPSWEERIGPVRTAPTGSATPVSIRPPVLYADDLGAPAAERGSMGGGFDLGTYLAGMAQQGGVSGNGIDPIMAASSGSGSAPRTGLDALTTSSIEEALRNPSAFDDAAVQQLYSRLGQDIDDRFAQEETQTREELARRGLSDSSILGGRLADLNVGRRQARTELADRLAMQRAQDFANARAAAIGMGQQQRQIGVGEGQLDLSRQRVGLDRNFGYLDRYMNYGQQAFENDLRQADFNRQLQNDQDQLMLRLLGLGG